MSNSLRIYTIGKGLFLNDKFTIKQSFRLEVSYGCLFVEICHIIMKIAATVTRLSSYFSTHNQI